MSTNISGFIFKGRGSAGYYSRKCSHVKNTALVTYPRNWHFKKGKSYLKTSSHPRLGKWAREKAGREMGC